MHLMSWMAVTAWGAEGMWTPEQIPSLAERLAADGITVDPSALADLSGDLMGAVVSLGGCTASFVSPDGLLITNHHCAYRSIQHNSTPERDLLKNGFLAEQRQDELFAAPGSYVYVTLDVRDVTAEVTGAMPRRIKDDERARLVEVRERTLVDACEAEPGYRCRVARFYEGTQLVLITQREIQDVRLVYAPPSGIGNFGGEVDNWMWPRHTGDFAFLRAYVGTNGFAAPPSEKNVPFRPPRWLKVSTEPLEEGDPVMVLGYPGKTSRYETADELLWLRTFSWPEGIRHARALIAILQQRSDEDGAAAALKNQARIKGLANAMKKRSGILAEIDDGQLEAARRAREAKLAATVAADKKLARDGDPVLALGEALRDRRTTEQRDLVLDWLAPASPMLGEAIALWRMAEERHRPDIEREDGFRDRDQTRFAQARARAQSLIEPTSDRATLRYLLEVASALPAEQRITALDEALVATGRSSGAERIDALLDALYQTRLADRKVREGWIAATTDELAAAGDPMLTLAASLGPLLLEVRDRADTHEGAMLRLRPAYVQALRASGGAAPQYPDANGTLRLTWGKVEPLSPRDAVTYAPRTTLPGLLEKVTAEPPFRAPEALIRAASQVPASYVDPALGTVPVDFIASCDITGGNSGSPTLDAQGRLIGVAFDGNLEGVASDHGYDPRKTRSIHVDAAYVRWVMDEVDHAEALLMEMGLPSSATQAAAEPVGTTGGE